MRRHPRQASNAELWDGTGEGKPKQRAGKPGPADSGLRVLLGPLPIPGPPLGPRAAASASRMGSAGLGLAPEELLDDAVAQAVAVALKRLLAALAVREAHLRQLPQALARRGRLVRLGSGPDGAPGPLDEALGPLQEAGHCSGLGAVQLLRRCSARARPVSRAELLAAGEVPLERGPIDASALLGAAREVGEDVAHRLVLAQVLRHEELGEVLLAQEAVAIAVCIVKHLPQVLLVGAAAKVDAGSDKLRPPDRAVAAQVHGLRGLAGASVRNAKPLECCFQLVPPEPARARGIKCVEHALDRR
mmetsp:Transcript_56562/g.171145  ORF Transcript_56562/g.171145 Transcript_56562/m.171145 type:complete len:303 (+) Transcript_56562:56-964(+)